MKCSRAEARQGAEDRGRVVKRARGPSPTLNHHRRPPRRGPSPTPGGPMVPCRYRVQGIRAAETVVGTGKGHTVHKMRYRTDGDGDRRPRAGPSPTWSVHYRIRPGWAVTQGRLHHQSYKEAVDTSGNEDGGARWGKKNANLGGDDQGRHTCSPGFSITIRANDTFDTGIKLSWRNGCPVERCESAQAEFAVGLHPSRRACRRT